VSELQLLKEELLYSHTLVTEMWPQWTELDHAFLAITNDADYNKDVYSKQLELMLAERIGVLNELKQKVAAYRVQLIAKE
jgi:hypothetical protein